MTAGKLRAVLHDLEDSAPVLIGGDPFPRNVVGASVILMIDEHGGAVRGISLDPECDEDYYDTGGD